MTGLVRKATLLAVLGLMAASVARGWDPRSHPEHHVPTFIDLVACKAGVADPYGAFTVTVNDAAGNPVQGCEVKVVFASDLKIYNTMTGLTVDCAARSVTAVSDATGVANFTITGATINTNGVVAGSGAQRRDHLRVRDRSRPGHRGRVRRERRRLDARRRGHRPGRPGSATSASRAPSATRAARTSITTARSPAPTCRVWLKRRSARATRRRAAARSARTRSQENSSDHRICNPEARGRKAVVHRPSGCSQEASVTSSSP